MAASVAFLGIQQVPPTQHLSGNHVGTAYEQQLGSCGWTTMISPTEPLVVTPQQGMAELLAAQHRHRADSLVCNNISVTLTSTPGMAFEPA